MVIIIILIVCMAIFFILILFRNFFWGSNRKLKEGMRLEAVGKFYEALTIYEYLLKEGKNVPELRWKIANICIKLNNVVRAVKEIFVLIQSKTLPENVSMLSVKKLLFECYMKMGKSKEAFSVLVEIYRETPEDPIILYELAKIYAGQRMPGRAIRIVEKCLKYNPNDPDLNYFIGKAYLDFGDPDKAIEYLEKTTRLRFFDNGRINYYLGILYYAKKDFNLALQHFSQVIKLRPMDNRLLSEAHHFIALCYKEKGLVDEAVTNFEKSQTYSELLPKDYQNKMSLYNQGVLLYKSGQFNKALEKFYKVKMLDYKYKDVDRIIKEISTKLKNGGKVGEEIINYINDNPLNIILKKGFLFSKVRFNVSGIETKSSDLLKIFSASKENNNGSRSNTGLSYNTINKFNDLNSKTFKEISRRLVQIIGYQIKSEPKFSGDDEYIDGNAINFFAVPLKNLRIRKEVLITIRRYKDTVPELSVSRFMDWFEEKSLEQGIFIASANFSTNALKVIATFPQIKFIDRIGLSKILGRIV